MTSEVIACSPGATVRDAARAMADAGVGALPVCDDDRRLRGIVTDRDIAVRVVAAGLDPARTPVGDIVGDGTVVTVGADEELTNVVATMKRHAVRRVPVMDGARVTGMLSQADIAEREDADEVGDMVRTISRAPDNSSEGP